MKHQLRLSSIRILSYLQNNPIFICMKLLKLILEAGGLSINDGKLVLSGTASPSDAFIHSPGYLKNNPRIRYSFIYNDEGDLSGKDIKKVADQIKMGNVPYPSEFENKIVVDGKNAVRTLFQDGKVGYVAWVGSKQPLTRKLAEWLGNELQAEVVPINKLPYSSAEDMVDRKKVDREVRKPSERESILRYANDMWKDTVHMNQEGTKVGHIRTTLLKQQRLRKYYKSKYDLENVIVSGRVLVIDDNVQSGEDAENIIEGLSSKASVIFYAPLRLNVNATKTEKEAEATSKSPIDLGKFPSEPKQAEIVGPKSKIIYVKNASQPHAVITQNLDDGVNLEFFGDHPTKGKMYKIKRPAKSVKYKFKDNNKDWQQVTIEL